MFKNKKIIVLSILLLILALVILSFVSGIFKKTPENYWLENNCECIERSNLKCPEGYSRVNEKNFCYKIVYDCPSSYLDLVNENCNQKTIYTNILRACSEYQCPDRNYKIK